MKTQTIPSAGALAGLIDRYHERLPRSRAYHQRAAQRLPGGVTSNLRAWQPFPIYFERADGAYLWDLDGNRYIDCASAQGVLAVGHRNPTVLGAVREMLERQTVNGASHTAEAELAELVLERYPFHDRVRLVTTGSEAVAHGIRLARAATGRMAILKAEGTYHGNYDATMVSFTPSPDEAGHARRPSTVPTTAGLTPGAIADTRVFPFNDLDAVTELFAELDGSLAAVIVEPVILNMGCTPADGEFLQGLRRLCDRAGALLIFDEAKTGTKIAWGGGPELFGVKPDITLLAKAIGGGFPIGAIVASEHVMEQLTDHRVWQTGSFAGNPISVAAATATLRDVLTREAHADAARHNEHLRRELALIIADYRLDAHVRTAGVTGAVFFRRDPIRNYRDALEADQAAWDTYWFGMVNVGVIPQAYGRDDAWTLSICHTDEEIAAIVNAFSRVAALLAKPETHR